MRSRPSKISFIYQNSSVLSPQIPATLIGRLAVDKNYKAKGYGGITLAEALKQIRAISKITGIKVILVDSLNDSAVSFYKAYGFNELDDDKKKLFLCVSVLA